ncbi:MAG: NPCBM/NEW2 domain-containing protein [Clostridia bacterium]|nr:NPCBM/NEW2 domain-containing protein [Clostridia bacterium]
MKRFAAVLTICMMLGAMLPPASSAALVPVRESLCGEWSVALSNGESGMIEVPSCLQMQGYDYPSYISMPSVWEQERIEAGKVPEDVLKAVYTKEFTLPAAWDVSDDIYLCFDAVAGGAQISLNNTQVAQSSIMGRQIRVLVKNIAVKGKNTLEVSIDKYGEFSYIEDFDGFNLTGIYGDVYLERSRIRDVVFSASANGALSLSAVTTGDVRASLYDGSEKKADLSFGENTLADVELWSAENPKLYTLRIEACDIRGNVEETKEYKVGFRTSEVQNGRLVLNGVPITLFGVCYSPISPRGALVMSAEEIKRDFALMKEYNINAVRVINGAATEALYAAADEAGLYVCVQSAIDINSSYAISPQEREARFRAAYDIAQNHASAVAASDEAEFCDLPTLEQIAVEPYYDDFSGFDSERGGFYREFADKLLWTKRNLCTFTTPLGAGRGVIGKLNGVPSLNEGYGTMGKSGEAFTIEVYVHPAYEDDVFASADGAFLRMQDGQIEFAMGDSVISAHVGNNFYGRIQHIAGVYSDGEMQLFCEDEFCANSVAAPASFDWRMGGEQHKNGAIVACALYDRALSLDELIEGAVEAAAEFDFSAVNITEDLSSEFLGYGGDWGDYPSNGSECAFGIFSAEREPYEEARALWHLYRPITAELIGSEGTVRIKNRMSFTDAAEYTVEWDTDIGGTVTESNTVHLLPILPHTEAEVTLGANPARPQWGDAYFNVRFMRGGKCFSHEQFVSATAPRKADARPEGALSIDGMRVFGENFTAVFDEYSGALLSYVFDGDELISGSEIAFGENDGWEQRYFETYEVEIENSADMVRISAFSKNIYTGAARQDTYDVYPDGTLEVSAVTDTAGVSGLLGTTFKLPREYEELEYFGFKDGFAGKYSSSFAQEFISHAEPRSVNTRRSAQYVKAQNDDKALLIASDVPFDFTASPYSFDMLEYASHREDLSDDGYRYIAVSGEGAFSLRIKGALTSDSTEADIARASHGALCSAIFAGGEKLNFAVGRNDYVVYADSLLEIDAAVCEGAACSVQMPQSIPGTAVISLVLDDRTEEYRVHFVPKNVYLSDIAEAQENVVFDKSSSGSPITFMGDRWRGEEDTVYEKGICATGESEVVIDVSSYGERTFEAVIGIDTSIFASMRGWGRGMFDAVIDYLVYLDGEEVYARRGFSFRDGSVRVSVDVTGAKELKLVTKPSSEELNLAVWADAKLVPNGPLTFYTAASKVSRDATAVVVNTDRDTVTALMWAETDGGIIAKQASVPRGGYRVIYLRDVPDGAQVNMQCGG